jgi:hypothetical protein
MTRGGFRLLMAVLVATAFGAGCGGEDVDLVIVTTPTPGGAVLTSTPAGSTPVRTATPVATATPAATATVGGGPTATAGGPTATAGGPTPTATGATPTATGPTASPTPGAVEADVQTAVDDLLPFFTIAGLTTGVSSAGAAQADVASPRSGIGTSTQAAVKVDDCPNGGTRTEDDQVTTVTITLAACKFSDPDLGNFQFDGTITASLLSQTAAFNVTAQDLTNSRSVTFTGSVTGSPNGSGGFVVNGGPITLTTPQGNFTLTLNNLTVDSDGNVVSGGGTLEDDDDNFDLMKIQVTIRTGGLLADMIATFDDNSTKSYVIDLKKGSITPAS